MKKRHLLALIVVWIFGSAPGAWATEVVVLVHGYLGGGENWRGSGIANVLVRAGWGDFGHLASDAPRVNPRTKGAARGFYTAELPSEMPIMAQGQVLARYLGWVKRQHTKPRLILVGHSAGGLVARLTMVQEPQLGVVALITIATPNLGTDRAELGLMAGQSPLSMLAPMFGLEELNRSQSLFADLVEERPGTFVYWLNRQPHPEAEYISIVRTQGTSSFGDWLVSPASQSLSNVVALQGRATVIQTEGGHSLTVKDGHLLMRLLGKLNNKPRLKAKL